LGGLDRKKVLLDIANDSINGRLGLFVGAGKSWVAHQMWMKCRGLIDHTIIRELRDNANRDGFKGRKNLLETLMKM